MGNTTSSRLSPRGHEKLDEHDEHYFEKVQARNETASTRGWRQGSTGARANHSRTSEENLEPKHSENIMHPSGTKIGKLKGSSQNEMSSRQAMKEHRSTSAPIKLASPRDAGSPSASNRARILASLSPLKSVGDHLDEPVKRTFDAMLPSGVVWADVLKGSKVICVAFSKPEDSSTPLLLAIGTEDGRVTVMEVLHDDSYRVRRSQTNGITKEMSREGKVRSLDFSGDWLAIGGNDCTATLVNINFKADQNGNRMLHKLEVVTELERVDRVYCVKFSPDGTYLAVGGFDGMVAICSITSRKSTRTQLVLVAEIRRSGLVFSVDWSPDGLLLAIGGNDKSCAIVDQSWGIMCEVQRPASITSIRWSPNGDHLCMGCRDGTVCTVEVASQSITQEIARCHSTRTAGDGDSASSMNSSVPASIGSNSLHCRVNSVCWSPDSNFLAIGGTDDCCAIIETRGFTVVYEIHRAGSVNCVAWMDQLLPTGGKGCYLALGGDDKAVAILKTSGYDDDESSTSDDSFDDASSSASTAYCKGINSPKSEWVLKEDFLSNDSGTDPPNFYSGQVDEDDSNLSITTMAFSKTKNSMRTKYMAIARANGNVVVYTTGDWAVVTKMRFSHAIRSVQFSWKSQFLALGGDGARVYIVSTANWRVLKEIKTGGTVNAIVFNRSDERLAVGVSDGILLVAKQIEGFLWEVAGEIEDNDSSIVTLDWSKKYLAVGRLDGSVSIHETENIFRNFLIPRLTIFRKKAVYSVAFGIGKYLAVTGADKTVSIYSAKGGWVLCYETKLANSIHDIKWNSNARFLAFISQDKTKPLTVFDTVTWNDVAEIKSAKHDQLGISTGNELTCLQWSHDDKFLAVAGSDGTVFLKESDKWKLTYAIKNTGIESLGTSPKAAENTV